jgi:tRNA (guanine-N7-)-methyltransferase
MSFGLGHGRKLDDAPGEIGIGPGELPPIPDSIMTNPLAGRIEPRRWFADPARALEIEIGCGKGGFILQETAANPGVNYLGIEYAREFYLYTADRIRRRNAGSPPPHSNVRMLHADASEFFQWRMPDACARVIHLYFSDPWPKTKHHKNRVIQDRFLADAWRILIPGGELRIVTDHEELWEWDVEHFERWTKAGGGVPPELVNAFGLPARPFEMREFQAPSWAEEGDTVGTNYERKMCGGRPPHACVLVRQ